MISKNIKKRYWAMVVYPDSAPNNWEEILIQTGLQCAISPLHDKDVNPDNTPKKAHYHVILCYENPTTYNNVLNLCQSLGQPIPQPLEQLRGYYRYLIHKDNPEKYQYNEYDIRSINGFDRSMYLKPTTTETISSLCFLTDLIEDNNITEYRDLIKLLKDNEDLHQYLEFAMTKTIFINSYIKSLKFKIKESID